MLQAADPTPEGGAWLNETYPITDPRHPTGLGLDADGILLVGWQGPGHEVRVDLDGLDDAYAIATLSGQLTMAGGPGMTAEKADFLGSVLARRLPRDADRERFGSWRQ